MTRRRPARVLVLVGALACGPVRAVEPAPAPPPATEAKVEEIQETTVGDLAGVSVGAANMWEREFVDGAGTARRGLTARLDWEEGGETRRVVVGEGSIVEIGGHRWQVVRLVKTEGANGTVALKPAP